jgi:ABC-type phosphate transport system substrate-binding protein
MRTASRGLRVGATLLGLALGLGSGEASAGVVAVVSVKSPVGTLGKNEIADIFLGKTSRYPDGHPAVPVDQTEGSPPRDEFYLQLAGKSPAQLKAHWSKIIFTGRGRPPRDVGNGVQVKKYLTENPEAIGYLEETLVDASLKVVLRP